MQATVASQSRAKKGLTLREKIFELHDAVRVLQTNDQNQRRQSSLTRQSNAPESTADQFSTLTLKVDGLDSQCAVLRQAIGTMADAVAEEIDDLKKDFVTDFEGKLNLLTTRVQNAKLDTDRTEGEQAKLRYQLDRILQEFQHQKAVASAAPEVPH